MDLSIILPVYNVEKYLNRCIQSLVAIESDCVEFIFINDSSTDASEQIIFSWQKRDRRISLFSKKNEGSGYARNFGLKCAKGKYIYFMDPDDWIETKTIEVFLDLIKTTDFDVYLFGYNVYLETKIKDKICYEDRKLYVSKHMFFENFKQMMDGNFLFQLWNKIYKREFLQKHGFLFTNQKTGQDALFNMKIFDNIESIFVLDEVLYNYYSQRRDSAQNSLNINKLLDNKKILMEYKFFCEKNHLTETLWKEYTIRFLFKEIIQRKSLLALNIWEDEEFSRIVLEEKVKHFNSRKVKLELMILKVSFWWTKKLK